MKENDSLATSVNAKSEPADLKAVLKKYYQIMMKREFIFLISVKFSLGTI